MYKRYGAVVELYVYSSPTTGYPQGTQLANLSGGEIPFPMYNEGPWVVTTTVDLTLGSPVGCVDAVQPTHDGMGSGQAGG